MRTLAQKQNQPQQKSSTNFTKSNRSAPAPSHEAHRLLYLQRTIGNQAVLQLLQARADGLEASANNEVGPTTERRSQPPTTTRFAHDFSRIPVHAPPPITLQEKLTVNTPGDSYEQEADNIAEQVMRMPEPKLQRACACGGGCPRCQTEQPSHEHQRLQTKHISSSDAGQTAALPIVHEVLASPGQPLDASTRAFFEPRFGHDFSQVRVHSDATAEQSARDVNAQAYTVGHNVVFSTAQFAPQTHEGRQLIAHELTHVVQQSSTSLSHGASNLVQRQTRVRDPRQRAKALKAADARTLLQGSLPFVLEHMTDEQIQKMQRVLDAAVVNPAVQKEANDIYRRSIIAESGGYTNRNQAMVRRGDRAMENQILLTEADKSIRLDYKTLLTPEALQSTTDNPDEGAYLKMVRQTLETQGVWLRFTQPYVRDPEDPSRHILDPRTFTAWLSLGPNGKAIPTKTGLLTRDELLANTTLGAGYYKYVHEGPIEYALKKEIHRLEVQIETGWEQHNMLARIRRQAALGVTEASDWFGGADFPDRAIWDLPHQFVLQALTLNVGGNVRSAQFYLYQAALFTRYAARLLANYIDDSTSGAERVVSVLTVVKKIGEVAEVSLAIMDGVAVARGVVSFVRGAREGAEISGAVAERVVGQHVAESPAIAVRGTENQVIRGTEKVGTEADKRAIAGSKGSPNPIAQPSHIGAEISDDAAKKAKEAWFNPRKLEEACVGSVAACEKTRITKELWTEEDIARKFGETDKLLTGKNLDLNGAKHYIQHAIGKSLSKEVYDLGANRLIEGNYVIFGGQSMKTLRHVVRASVKQDGRLVIYDPLVAGRKITWFGFIGKYGPGSRAYRILD